MSRLRGFDRATRRGTQFAELEAKAEEERKKEVADVVAEIMAKVAPKYRDPASGNTWRGRDRAPKWIQEAENRGVKREKFRIG